MGRKVFIVGVGMTKFEKPFSKDWDYPDMIKESGTKAFEDAGLTFEDIEQAAVGYCYGDSTYGQRSVYGLGMTGIPIYNVNNNCATASTATFMIKQFIEGGIIDCGMALGFEKMEKGSLGLKYTDRTTSMDKHMKVMIEKRGWKKAPPMPQLFGNAGLEHMEKYGTTAEQFHKIGYKNHKHSVNNPYSQFQDEYTLQEIQDAPMVSDPLTKLCCCPTSDGSGAAILCNEDFMKKHNLQDQAIEILGMTMTTDFPDTFDSMAGLCGYTLSQAASRKVYEQSGMGPEDVDVIELHDCFATNEMLSYEALGLCPEGKGGEFVDSEANTYGGKIVVNPSGGLISKGHPLGATGLAQCAATQT
ncbi:MAG: lipid-transfer protein [Deltaproteobacteria bacterium]|nr:lipid-transfer protein [Deltaproteobacteria bacterium]